MFQKKWFNILMIGAIAVLSLSALAFTPYNAEHAPGPGGKGGAADGFSGNSYLADALGISTDELQAVFESVRSSNPGPGDNFQAALAEALGISEDALAAAQQSAHTAALDQALADGKLTQEEYDLAIARQGLRDYMDRDAMIAAALGISVDEWQTAQQDGQRIPDLLDELDITQEVFQTAMQTAQQAALEKAIADGVITQEQADQIGSSEFHGGPDGGQFPGGRNPGGQRPGGNEG